MKKILRASHRSVAVLAFSSTALLGLSALLALQASPVANTAKPDASHQTAQALDNFVQPRFQDDRAGVFGLTRIITPDQLAGVNGHQGLGLIAAKTPTEATLLSQVADTHRDYLIAFLHCAHVPGHYKGDMDHPALQEIKPSLMVLATRPPVEEASSNTQTPAHPVSDIARLIPRQITRDLYTSLNSTAVDALPKLKQGKPQEKVVGEWLVSMRPVKAEKESCLGCHIGAKTNDTLGVMVYAVKQQSDSIKS